LAEIKIFQEKLNFWTAFLKQAFRIQISEKGKIPEQS